MTTFDESTTIESIKFYLIPAAFHEALLDSEDPMPPEKTVHLLRGIVIELDRNDEEFVLHSSPKKINSPRSADKTA